MSISSALLLAHYCCIVLLLSVSITSVTPRSTRTSESDRTALDNKHLFLDSFKGKCQFNLTDSVHSLEAESSTYQHHGFSQCEYFIQAPSSRFILLNFTDIRSQSDMLVEFGVRREHYLQAATTTTTTILSNTQFFKTLLRPQSGDKNVNTTSPQSDIINDLLPTEVNPEVEKLKLSHPNSLHNSSTYNSIGSDSDKNTDNHKRQHPIHTILSHGLTSEQELYKELLESSSSYLKTDIDNPTTTRKNSFLELSTLSRSSDINIPTDSEVLSHNCSLKLIIEEVNITPGSYPQVICWGNSWQNRTPIVFQYSVPIRITYVWDRHSHSSFSLDFSFLRSEEVDHCLFRCNNHLCLPKQQVCDGYFDCPDQSDEQKSACLHVRQQKENGEPGVIKVIIIIISVIVGIIIVLTLVFMINHCRCYDGAYRGGGSLLQPPHSHSSEESGQYEPVLHTHPRQQTVRPPLTAASSHCSEHQQLLHAHQPDVEQQQRYVHHASRNHCINPHNYMSQEYHIRSLNSHAEVSADHLRVIRPLQHPQQLQQKFVHQQQQQRQCKQAQKHVSPSELYPPNIPLSADGEEGYVMSQKVLHSKQQLERNWQVENEVFRPPPNKTVYDRDSPPPPYSLNPPGTKSLDSLVPPVGSVCVLRQAQSSLVHQGSPAGVPRSHSLSCHH